MAVTVLPVVALRPVPGDQLYVLAPLAVSVIPLPEQMVAAVAGLIETGGRGFTVMVLVAVELQPLALVPVSVYVVVVAGVAITVAPVVVLSPVDGDQL